MPDLDIGSLKTLIAVVETGGFTQASSVVGRSQSAVSMQIKKIEDSVGHTLLERGPSGARLTATGQEFLPQARALVEAHDGLLVKMGQPKLTGRVRLGIMDDYAAVHLPRVLAVFREQFPGVVVEVTTGTTAQFLPRVGKDFDIVIATEPVETSSGRILRREDVGFAVVKGWRRDQTQPLPLALLGAGNLFREWALQALNAAGIDHQIVFQGNSIQTIEAMAEAGLAVTVAKRSTAADGLNFLGKKDDLPSLPSAAITLHEGPACDDSKPASRLRDVIVNLLPGA